MPSQEVSYAYGTASGIITHNKCHLFGVIATPKDDKQAYLQLYDGSTASQPKVLQIECATGASNSVIFPTPVKMNSGIYVAIPTDLHHYTILWHTMPDE